MKRECSDYHATEANRIEDELSRLTPVFTKDGIVRYVLRERIKQEKRRAANQEKCEHS